MALKKGAAAIALVALALGAGTMTQWHCPSTMGQGRAGQGAGDASTNESSADHGQPADVPLATLRCDEEKKDTSVIARWDGAPISKEFSPTHGFHHLRFQFPDGEELEFHPQEAPMPGEWTCNIFSPGCGYVALLQSNVAGYHVVELSRLRDYLAGRSPPFATVRYPDEPLMPRNHRHGHWVSPTQFEFFAVAVEAGEGDAWNASSTIRVRADVTQAVQGRTLPLTTLPEPLAEAPDDGCAVADVRP